jgi:hypothetical protein
MPKTLIFGPVYHTLSIKDFEYIPYACITLSSTGVIESIVSTPAAATEDKILEHLDAEIYRLLPGQFIIPGFVDSTAV